MFSPSTTSFSIKNCGILNLSVQKQFQNICCYANQKVPDIFLARCWCKKVSGTSFDSRPSPKEVSGTFWSNPMTRKMPDTFWLLCKHKCSPLSFKSFIDYF